MINLTSLKPFDVYSSYYDLLYHDKDYAAEVEYIKELLVRFGPCDQDLLEFGCGTGRHGCLLAESGYRVTGIERSLEMVEKAGHASGFTCLHGDICTVQLDRTFGAVISLFHVLSYQTTNTEFQAVLARAAQHLEVGGLFLFDVWYSPAVYAQRPEVRVKRLASDSLEITRLGEPRMYVNDNRVDVLYTIFARDVSNGVFQIFTETHPMRHFSLPELDLFASGAGFVRVCAEEFLTGAEPSENSWGLCVVLRKI